MTKLLRKIAVLESKLAAKKFIVCMDFAVAGDSDSFHEANMLGAHYLDENGKWSRDSRQAKQFDSADEAEKFAKAKVSRQELSRPHANNPHAHGGSAPEGHGGAYVATLQGYKLKPVKAIKP